MDRPILFKDEMVRAILEDRKTQTRRIVKSIDHDLLNMMCEDIETGKPNSDLLDLLYGPSTDDDGKRVSNQWLVRCTECPEEGVLTIGQGYGQPGDRLWVREKFATHFIWDDLPPGHIDIQHHSDGFFYADGTITSPGCEDHQRGKWRPSIHMPRWASRITLEITDVRVERLQDISEEDAIAEGAGYFQDLPGTSPYEQDDRWSMESPDSCDKCLGSARMAFANYFCKIAGSAPKGLHDPRPWDANPWVWVIEFRRVD